MTSQNPREPRSTEKLSSIVTDLQREVTLEEHYEENEEVWLVSYADLMTLLFGFFVMLFSFSMLQIDSSQFVRVRKDLLKYFGGTQLNAPAKMKNAVSSELSDNPGTKLMMNPYGNGLSITLMSTTVFKSGSTELTPQAADTLTKLAKVVRETGKDAYVTVEGHTDDTPLHSKIFPSNWELSAARAAAVVRLFQAEHFPENRLGAVGYGSSRPLLPNRDAKGVPIPANQEMNRRVIIKVSFDTPTENPSHDEERSPAKSP